MRKIIFLLVILISGFSFSGTCNWVSDPDVLSEMK